MKIFSIAVVCAFALLSVANAKWFNYFKRFMPMSSAGDFSCIDESGNPVDWWVMYKQPKVTSNPDLADGSAYVYIDANSVSQQKFKMGDYTLADSRNPIARTLHKVYNADQDATYFFYNDQPPHQTHPGATRAHAKGMVVFDNVQGEKGLWIVSSYPEFPNPPNLTQKTEWIWEAAPNYGQHFFCNSLTTSHELNNVGRYVKTIVPFIFADNTAAPAVAAANAKLKDKLRDVFDGITVGTASLSSDEFKKAREGVPDSQQFPMILGGGRPGVAFAKDRAWNKELYKDLVSLGTGKDLDVETWRRVHVLTPYCGNPHVYDVQYMHFKDQGIEPWKYTKDHSKWAVAADNTLICIGDINREDSQKKRGGGTLCAWDADLAAAFRNVIQSVNGYDDC